MRRMFLGLALSALIVCPGAAFAQVNVGGQASWADDIDDFGLGARVSVGLPVQTVPLELIGSFDYFFPEGGDYWEANANVAYLFSIPRSPVKPYAGGGLNVSHVSSDFSTFSDTDLAVNLLGGVRASLPRVEPFGELRVEIGNDEQFVVTAGVSVQVGPGFASSK